MELLHRRCCGLEVHKETVVACLRLVSDGKVTTEVRTFQTITADLLRLSEWLAINGCTHVAMVGKSGRAPSRRRTWHILDYHGLEALPIPFASSRAMMSLAAPMPVVTISRVGRARPFCA
jgi:hypothetical protein